jgi:hypothetical protein
MILSLVLSVLHDTRFLRRSIMIRSNSSTTIDSDKSYIQSELSAVSRKHPCLTTKLLPDTTLQQSRSPAPS